MAVTYILGAGASFGSGLPQSGQRPPLVKDMFKRASRVGGGTSFDRVASWCKDRFGIAKKDLIAGRPDFEEVLGRFDAEWARVGTTATQDNVTLGLERRDLLALIYDIFPGSTVATLSATCPYHDAIARSLASEDTIVNFNYDFLMEASLEGTGKQHDHGIGVELMGLNHEWDGSRLVPIDGFKANREDPPHLKLHGSLGWFRRTAFAEMEPGTGSGPPSDAQAIHVRIVAHRRRCVRPPIVTWDTLKVGTSRYVGVEAIIVPPAPVKSELAGPEWKNLWAFARQRLEASARWVAIGYSFRQADSDANSLFEQAGKCAGRRLTIDIVAPSDGPTIAMRVRKLLPQASITNRFRNLGRYAARLAQGTS